MIKKMEATKWCITHSSSKTLWGVRFGGKVLCLECMACPKIQLNKTERKKQWKSPCAGACACNYHHHYHLVLLLPWTNPRYMSQKRNKKGTESNVLHYAKWRTTQTCSFSLLSFLILSIMLNTTNHFCQFVDHHDYVCVYC